MKSSVKTLFLICISLFTLSAVRSSAQEAIKVRAIDQHSVNDKLHALECERLADSCSNPDKKARFILERTNYLKKAKCFDECLSALSTININSLSDSLSARVRYEIALMALLTGNKETVYLQIQYLEQNIKLLSTPNNYYEIKTLFNIQIGDYPNALQSAFQCINASEYTDKQKDSLKKTINIHFEKSIPKQTAAERQALWSAFLPGSYQMFHSHFGEGLASLLLNGGLISLVAYDFSCGLYFNSFAVLFSIFPRFYLAGIERAKLINRENNERRLNEFNRKTLELLNPDQSLF